MSAVEKYEAQAPMSGNPAHVRLGINQITIVANHFAESGLFKVKEKVNGQWIDRPMNGTECFAIIMAGQALGIGPMPAMMSFHIIEGRPEMSANLQAHFLKASPKYDYRMAFVYADNGEVDACKVTVFDTNGGEAIGESLFTRAMAQKAGLIRERGNWMKYAESMLFARAISNAVAWHAPDAVPMRIYSDGEMQGGPPDRGVQPVAGEGPPSTAKVEAIVERALAEEPVEEVPESEVGITEPEPQVGIPEDQREGDPEGHARQASDEAEARFAPEVVESRLREDLPKLDTDQKEIIKSTVEATGLEWGYRSIVHLIIQSGHSDVFSWLRSEQAAVSATPVPEEAPGPPEGVTGSQTGSQTSAVVSDAQIRLFNAKCSEAGFTEDERKTFLRKFAQADSSRAIAKKDFDDLLLALKDIAAGGPETKTAYLGE